MAAVKTGIEAAIDAAARQRIVDTFLDLYRSTEGAANPSLLADAEVNRVRQNDAAGQLRLFR